MKFNFGEKLETFQDSNLSTITALDKSRGKLIIKIVVAIISVLAIVNAILIGIVNSKVKALYQDKEAMAESLGKISAVLDKPAKAIPQSAFMTQSMLSDYTNTILKQMNNIINQRDTMVASLQNIAEVTHYAALNISDANDMKLIQSRLMELEGHLKKLFELNGKLSVFVLKTASLTGQSGIGQNELIKKLNVSPEDVCLPILGNIEKNKEAVGSLQQEIVDKTKTIAELKNTMEGVNTNKNELQQIIQQKQSELVKAENEYSNLKTQIENIKKQPRGGKSSAVAVVTPVKKVSYPEFYYKLKGEIVEYNSKWGFIIINFGSDSKLRTSIEGEEKEVKVPAPLDKEAYIARGGKFVAKAKIINVYSRYSVANIIFPVAEEIKKGDSVFFELPKSN